MGHDREIRVDVVYMAEHQELDFPRGTAVGDIKDYLRHVLNIPRDSQARVDGKNVSRKHRLRKNCTLEFIKTDGRKGGDFFSESRLLKLGATQQWVDKFCAESP